MTVMKRAAVSSLLRYALKALQGIARIVGPAIAFFGWCPFAAGSFFLVYDEYPDSQPFRNAAPYLTGSWLLMRFASGLFPFGKRLFRDTGTTSWTS